MYKNFNQTANCLGISSDKGVRLYQCEPFALLYSNDENGYGIVEMLHTTSLLLLVGSGVNPLLSKRTLYIRNIQLNTEVCKFNFESAILNIKLNSKRIIVMLSNQIHIIDINTMKHIKKLDIPTNNGKCSLSTHGDNCLLAYSSNPPNGGELLIYDALNLQIVTIIQAHQNPIHIFEFNRDGSMIVTCSTKGTVIRIFSVRTGQKLHTFRRGSYPVSIHSIAFNPSSTLIALTSESPTVHIFSLKDETPSDHISSSNQKNVSKQNQSKLSSLMNFVQDVVDPSRHFAQIRLKENVPPTKCAFFNDYTLMVILASGILYKYNVPIKGGACILEEEQSLLSSISTDEAMEVKFHSN